MCLLKECVKFVVFAFNLVFVIVGAALITLGTIYLVNFTEVTKAIPDAYDQIRLIPILTIVIGSIIFVIAFFGCCGAIRSSACLLTTYAVILLIIFILQIALGVFAFLEIKNEQDFSKSINQTINGIFVKPDNASVEIIDVVQKELHCCGTYGPAFWKNELNKEKPDSCYKDSQKLTYYTEGCSNAFYTFLKDAAKIIGIVVLALAATEVIGAIFSLCLANSIRNEVRRTYY